MTPTTPENLLADTRAALATARSELDTLLAVKGGRTEADTLAPYHRLQLALSNAGHRAGLLSEVHPDKPLREAAELAVQEISAYATELSLHRGLYDALAAVDVDGARRRHPALPRAHAARLPPRRRRQATSPRDAAQGRSTTS